MGRNIASVLLEKESFEVVGAVDISPGLIGKDLGSILAPTRKTGVSIVGDAESLFNRVQADAVVLTTTSHLEAIFPQIEQCVRGRLNIVSTCEELSFPMFRNPKLSEKIDRLAKEYGVTVVGTGINPGYLMDLLPLVLTGPCLKVNSVQVTRMMDSSKRRIPFQTKVGTGLSPEEFQEKIEKKIITGHVGLLESLHMIAAGIGWHLEEAVENPPRPVIAEEKVQTGLGEILPGKVIGLISTAYAKKAGQKVITLHFHASADVAEEYDEVIITGVPSIHEKILGGVHGDLGTVAITVNTIPRAVGSSPGLRLMKDLAPPFVTA